MSNKKTAEVFDFALFDYAKYADSFRELAEKNVTQSSEAYENFRTSAEEITQTAQKAFEAMREGMTTLSNKAIENTKTNTEASLAYFEKLAEVRNVSDLIELQSTYFRTSFEILSEQAREAQELSVKTGEKVVTPISEATEKTVEKAADRATSKVA
jgi:phasin